MVGSWCCLDWVVPEGMSQISRRSEVGNHKRRSLNTRLSSDTFCGNFHSVRGTLQKMLRRSRYKKRTEQIFCTRSEKWSENRSSRFEPILISFSRGSGPPLKLSPRSKHPHRPSPEGRTLYCLQFSSRFWDLGILPHIKCQFRRFETERPSVITRVIIRQSKFESAHQASHQVSPPPCAAAEPRMGDHKKNKIWGIMSRMAWSTRTTRKRKTRTMSRCRPYGRRRPVVSAAASCHCRGWRGVARK